MSLEEEIKKYADNYYQGNELISDEEYDALIEKLRKEKPDSTILPENGGIVGSDLKGISKKYKLPVTMGTLAKCNTDEEFEEWWDKHQHNDIIVESKIDGNGLLLEFENGKLIRAYSRGDSEYAEDRTVQINAILNRRKNPTNGNVAEGFYGWIRGEALLKRSIFDKNFKDKGYKNPRNMVAGLLGRENLSEEDLKDLNKCSFIAYDVFISPKNKIGNSMVDTEIHKLKFLQTYDYEIPKVDYNATFNDIKEWKNSINTANSEIPVDGIVIKQNEVDVDDLMRKTPLNNVAYKPNLQTAVSIIRDIKWQLQGRYISPVAVIDPVELEETTVQRASLANLNIMKKKGVYIGAMVTVSKHGMIIPYVETVLEPKKDGFEIPKNCPKCGSLLKLNSNGILECVNENCFAKEEHRFAKVFDILNIKAAGPSFIKTYVAQNKNLFDLLSDVKDKPKEVFNEVAGGINGEKIYKQLKPYIDKEKSITVYQLLALLDYPGLGVKQFEKINDLTFDKFFKFKDAGELSSYLGIGDEVANDILNFKNNYSAEIKVIASFFKIEEKKKFPSICFTGSCPGYSRKELVEMCKNYYIIFDTVTKDLNILACADPSSGSSKLKKALKNGTKIISYDDLLKEIKV